LFWNYTISDCMKQDVVVNDMFSRLLKYTMSKAQDTRESKEYLWDAVEIFKKNNLFCNYEEVWDSIYEFYTAFIPEEENLNCFYYYCEIMDYAAKEINVAFEESIRKRILEVFSHGRYDTNDIDTHSEGGIESAIAKLRVVDDYFGVCMRSTIIGLEEASEELQRGRYEERIAQDDEIEYLNRAESSSENDFLFGVGQDKEIETLFEEFNKKIGG